MDNRSVSDVIGFILIFALIMSSIAIVYATGFENLDNAREAEEIKNVERAYDILDDNLRDVARGEAPSRGTEVKLGNSQLYLGDPVIVTANVTNASGDTITSKTITYPIVYETPSNQRMIYVNGAVIRDVRGGATMVSEPRIIYDSDRVLFPLIETRPDSAATGVSGGTVLIRGRSKASGSVEFNNASNGPYDVNFTVETPRTEVWERYCTNQPGLYHDTNASSNSNATAVECAFNNPVDDVYVQFRQIGIEIL